MLWIFNISVGWGCPDVFDSVKSFDAWAGPTNTKTPAADTTIYAYTTHAGHSGLVFEMATLKLMWMAANLQINLREEGPLTKGMHRVIAPHIPAGDSGTAQL